MGRPIVKEPPPTVLIKVQQAGKEVPEQVRPVWVRMRLHQSMQELQAAVCTYSRLQWRDWTFTYCGRRIAPADTPWSLGICDVALIEVGRCSREVGAKAKALCLMSEP